MQAYATAEHERLRLLDPTSRTSSLQGCIADESYKDLIDLLLGRVADLVVDRLTERNAPSTSDPPGEWLDARGAAEYLAIHRDTLRKLAAQRAIPAHQDGPRCKLYFRRDELDDWRRSARPMRATARRLRAVS